MRNLSMSYARPRTYAISFAVSLLLVIAVACGNSADPTPATGALDQTPAAPVTTPGGAGTAPTDTATGQLGGVGVCLEQNTDAGMVEDLRAGQTESAESVYETCLEDVLPASVVADLEPVIQQAAACGQTASADLTDADVQALEDGDRDVAQRLSAETLTCLSNELGIPLN